MYSRQEMTSKIVEKECGIKWSVYVTKIENMKDCFTIQQQRQD